MYLQLANNNSYGIKNLPDDIFEEASNNITKPGGCYDLLNACREAQVLGDPDDLGTNSTVNEICAGATEFCWAFVQGAYVEYSGVSVFCPLRFPRGSIGAKYPSAERIRHLPNPSSEESTIVFHQFLQSRMGPISSRSSREFHNIVKSCS